VKKIIITSSIAAVFPGINNKNNFTFKDWSILKECSAYDKSKHYAEAEAWTLFEKYKS
jgi:hypothetical protein